MRRALFTWRDWDTVAPVAYLAPFLQVIRSVETSGPITGCVTPSGASRSHCVESRSPQRVASRATRPRRFRSILKCSRACPRVDARSVARRPPNSRAKARTSRAARRKAPAPRESHHARLTERSLPRYRRASLSRLLRPPRDGCTEKGYALGGAQSLKHGLISETNPHAAQAMHAVADAVTLCASRRRTPTTTTWCSPRSCTCCWSACGVRRGACSRTTTCATSCRRATASGTSPARRARCSAISPGMCSAKSCTPRSAGCRTCPRKARRAPRASTPPSPRREARRARTAPRPPRRLRTRTSRLGHPRKAPGASPVTRPTTRLRPRATTNAFAKPKRLPSAWRACWRFSASRCRSCRSRRARTSRRRRVRVRPAARAGVARVRGRGFHQAPGAAPAGRDDSTTPCSPGRGRGMLAARRRPSCSCTW